VSAMASAALAASSTVGNRAPHISAAQPQSPPPPIAATVFDRTSSGARQAFLAMSGLDLATSRCRRQKFPVSLWWGRQQKIQEQKRPLFAPLEGLRRRRPVKAPPTASPRASSAVTPAPPTATSAAMAGRGAEAPGGVDRHRGHHVAGAGAGGGDEERVAAAGDIPGHDRGDHNAAVATGGRGPDGPGRRGAHQDLDLRGGLLGLRGPDTVAHRTRLLLRPWLHQDGARQPRGLPIRGSIRELVAGIRVQPGVQRGAPRPSDPLRLRPRWRHLFAACEVPLRGLRKQRRRRDGGTAGIVAYAHLLPDVRDFLCHVLDGHGG
jgi:hypothetical protein